MLAAEVSYQVQTVAVGWHIFSLGHRALDLGLVGLVLFVPTFAFALPAGFVADHRDRRLVVAVTLLAEALAMVAFVVAVAQHVVATWPYFVVLAWVGTARAFGTPAERALLPGIVPPERYMRAQALWSTIREGTGIGGPALGGFVVALSTTFAFGLCAVGLAAAAAILGALRLERVPAEERPPATLHGALEGLRFIRSRREIAGAITLDLFAVLFGGATALLPAFADGVFHAGPQGLGFLRAAPTVGAALVAATISRRPIHCYIGPRLFGVVGIFGLATIGFALSRNFVLSLVLLALAGGADMVSVVIRNGLVSLSTPENMRGRVLAVENVFIGASNELGAFESGGLAALMGVVPSVVAGGLGTLVVLAVAAVAFPSLRRADRFPAASALNGPS